MTTQESQTPQSLELAKQQIEEHKDCPSLYDEGCKPKILAAEVVRLTKELALHDKEDIAIEAGFASLRAERDHYREALEWIANWQGSETVWQPMRDAARTALERETLDE